MIIVTSEMRAKILADYNAMRTAGEKASYARKLKKAGLPVPVKGAKHSVQDGMVADLLAMGLAAAKPTEAPKADKPEAPVPQKKAA